jgi:hypothetical protein
MNQCNRQMAQPLLDAALLSFVLIVLRLCRWKDISCS